MLVNHKYMCFFQHPPYIFINGSDEFENKTYSGFIVDLIDLLSKMLGFRYEFYESPDGRFGAATVLPQGNITWNGMMGELMKNEVRLHRDGPRI